MLDCSTSLDAFLKSVREKTLVNIRQWTPNLRVIAVLHATSKRLLMQRKKSKRSMLLENDKNEENDGNTSPKRKRINCQAKISEGKDFVGLHCRNKDDGANLFVPVSEYIDEEYDDVKRFDEEYDYHMDIDNDEDDENEIVDIETPDDELLSPCT